MSNTPPLGVERPLIPEKPVAEMTNAELAAAMRGNASPNRLFGNGPFAQMLEAAKRLEKLS